MFLWQVKYNVSLWLETGFDFKRICVKTKILEATLTPGKKAVILTQA